MRIVDIQNHAKASLNFIRVKPDTFIVGFQKCGTTSLYNYLLESQCYIPGKRKENDLLTTEGGGLSKYLAQFPIRFDKSHRTLCASHQVAFNPLGIDRLKHNFPSAKFIFIMRDPVERAYSRYKHNQKKVGAVIDKKFQGNFLSNIDREITLLKNINDIYDINELYHLNSKYNLYGLPISRGIYYTFIKRFIENKMDCYFLSLEDLTSNHSFELSKLYDFLNIQGPIAGENIYNQGSSSEAPSSVLEAMEKLRRYYSEPNQKLYELIDKDFCWQ